MSWKRGSLLNKHEWNIVQGLIDLVLVGSEQILISYPSSGGELNNCLYSRFVDTPEETHGGTLAERCDRDDVKNTFDSFDRFVSFFDCCCSFCSKSSLSGAESQAGQEVLFQHTPE